ncbi:MAG: glucose-1-phosphate cytidylyltransferase [Thermoplasmatales archaeon]
MKVVILAGGLGTRLSEETTVKPKPMVEIGEKPILWHIMKIYSYYGYNDFIICLGYKGYILKEFFANYLMHNSSFTVNLADGKISFTESKSEQWIVTLLDTGLNTMTGGRIKRAKKYLQDDTFMMTYGDGVADLNINDLVQFHRKHGKMATISAVQPPGRFGSLSINEEDQIAKLVEKPLGDNAWVNAGFFVLEPDVFDYIEGDESIWEREPLETISSEGNLVAYKHKGFWQPVDTLREKNLLNELWNEGRAPWKVWND